jgi:predicted transcriptional regulator
MNQNLVVIPQQMMVREAARLLHRVGVCAAPVVDQNGRCVGMLSPADILRWVEAGCLEVLVGPALTCPYQVRGRLTTGQDAVICILAHGNCPFQVEQPTTGGRHMDVCMRKETDPSPLSTVHSYTMMGVNTIGPDVPLHALARQIIGAAGDRLIVLDEGQRPVGMVSANDVLKAIADEEDRDDSPGDPRANMLGLRS